MPTWAEVVCGRSGNPQEADLDARIPKGQAEEVGPRVPEIAKADGTSPRRQKPKTKTASPLASSAQGTPGTIFPLPLDAMLPKKPQHLAKADSPKEPLSASGQAKLKSAADESAMSPLPASQAGKCERGPPGLSLPEGHPPKLSRPWTKSDMTQSTSDDFEGSQVVRCLSAASTYMESSPSSTEVTDRDTYTRLSVVHRPWWSTVWLSDDQLRVLRTVEEIAARCFGADFEGFFPTPSQVNLNRDHVSLQIHLSRGTVDNLLAPLARLQGALCRELEYYACKVVRMERSKDDARLTMCCTTFSMNSCWEAVRFGVCPRGRMCRWEHPKFIFLSLTVAGEAAVISSSARQRCAVEKELQKLGMKASDEAVLTLEPFNAGRPSQGIQSAAKVKPEEQGLINTSAYTFEGES